MSEEEDNKKWGRITTVGLIVAVIIAAAVWSLTDIFNGLFAFLIVSGAYLAISFYIRDDSKGAGGPSAIDGAIMGGVLLAGIGACGLVHTYLNDVMVTSVCLLVVLIATAGVMIVRNRRYL